MYLKILDQSRGDFLFEFDDTVTRQRNSAIDVCDDERVFREKDQRPRMLLAEFDAQSSADTPSWNRRQTDMVEKTRRLEEKVIPEWVEYTSITGLKKEAQTKLQHIQPKTLGQAGRISGITPADISLLAVWLERGNR